MCKSESIKVYEVTKETAEKLKVDEEELMYIETEYGEKSVEIRSNFSVRHDNLKPEEYRLKCHIKEKLDKLRAVKGEILIATYGGERPKGSDIENLLFYNIGTGAFSKVFQSSKKKQVAFWVEDNNDGQHIKYRYEINNIPKNIADKLENPLAKWENITIGNGNTLPEKPDEYFTALRTNINNNEITINSKEQCKTSFGIKITLTVPASNTTTHPVSVMKHLLDGVICAFHGEKDGTDKRVREKFKNNGLNDEMIDEFFNSESKMNLFGNHVYLTRSNRWNPEDDRLKFGWIIVKCEGEEYKMSGEIYNWD